jgi:hypothetical protein
VVAAWQDSGMTAQPPDEPPAQFDEAALELVFGPASPASVCAAVLTEAKIVLPEIVAPLDAELWGSDIVAALRSADVAAPEVVRAAEQSATPQALAMLRVLGAVGSPGLRGAAAAAADRLAGRGLSEPRWAAGLGSPEPGECWRYADAAGAQEAVTVSFHYGAQAHVVSVLIDLSQGGAIQDIWIGPRADVLARTRQMSAADPEMTFEMIDPADARARLERAIAAGECPRQPEEAGNVASRAAILRARVALLPSPRR